MAMDGPRICTFSGQREQVGSRSEWELVIGRTDGTIQLLYGDGLDDNLLTGELAGERFTAGSGPVTLTFPGCRTRHLIGRFSAGLRQLTAREEWIYIAEDHETTMKLTFDGRQSRLLRGLHG